MNRHQLATLLYWAGENGLTGRKRLQKVVFFLKQAGCSMDCRYTLHFFGPYSRDVAETCDEMVAAGLIDEAGGPQNGAMTYVYTLTPKIRDLVSKTPDPQMLQFEAFGKQLLQENNWLLELGATILFFYGQIGDWDRAMEQACDFKKVLPTAKASNSALQLAKKARARSAG